jgi:hypothetical protein
MTKGWSSDGLPTVGDDEKLWTAAQAAVLLGPPDLTTSEVRRLIQTFNLKPVGKRRTTGHGQPGRHARVYKAIEFIGAYDDIQKRQQEFEGGEMRCA